jgi:hypothetical protein
MRCTQANPHSLRCTHETRFPSPPPRHPSAFTTGISPSRVQEALGRHAGAPSDGQRRASAKECNARFPSNCENPGDCAVREMRLTGWQRRAIGWRRAAAEGSNVKQRHSRGAPGVGWSGASRALGDCEEAATHRSPNAENADAQGDGYRRWRYRHC